MTNWLAKPLEWYSAAKNVVLSVGPYLIAQSDQSSEAFARHKLRMANADAAKTLLLAEAQSIADIRDMLRKQYAGATPEERIRIRRDMEDSERDVRQLHTAAQALHYLPDFTEQCGDTPNESQDDEKDGPTISDHWMDKFNQLARSKNEDWRRDLLARALAAEAAKPGSICARALWLIGTLEEDKFQAFSALLDVASIIGRSYMIPGDSVFEQKIPSCDLGKDIQIGSLVYQLNDTGLIADFTTEMSFLKGQRLVLGYDRIEFTVDCESDLTISGLVLSTIGNSISLFYQRRENPFGRNLLNEWLASLNVTNFKVRRHLDDRRTIACTGTAVANGF